MRTSNLIRVTTLAAVIAGLAGTARADTFVSVQSGNWSDYTNVWLQNSFPAARAPDVGDDVTIQDNHTVDMDDDFGATALTIEGRGVLNVNVDLSYPYTRYTLTLPSGGSADIFGKLNVNGILDVNDAAVTVEASAEVDIENGAVLTVHGTSPSITVNNTGLFKMFNGAAGTVAGTTTFTTVSGGSFLIVNGVDIALSGTNPHLIVNGNLTLEGRLELDGSGTPTLEVQSSQDIPAATGDIVGIAAASVVQINSSVTVTNKGLIHGQLIIKGASSNTGIFANQGSVDADDAGSLELDSTLNAVTDTSASCSTTPRWVVSGSGFLYFNRAATLYGSFKVGPGELTMDANVSTSGYLKLLTGGDVYPQGGAYFNAAGYCSGSDCTPGSFPTYAQLTCP